jgi:hypothetical protein
MNIFPREIVGSDLFLDMPLGSQALWFHLFINSNSNCGHIINVKAICRMINAKECDLNLLLDKKFLTIESDIYLIRKA